VKGPVQRTGETKQFTQDYRVKSAYASTDGLQVSGSRDAAGNAVIHVSTVASNPLTPYGPAADNHLILTVPKDGETIRGIATLDGYPSVEVYATTENGVTTVVLQYPEGEVSDLYPQWGNRAFNIDCWGIPTGGRCVSDIKGRGPDKER
jgi:hypothetical protein